MRYKKIFLAAFGIFMVMALYFTSRSEAFNTFTSANDETKIDTQSLNTMIDIKNIDAQILEQLKITNDLLRAQAVARTSTPQAPASVATPVPQVPQGLRPLKDFIIKYDLYYFIACKRNIAKVYEKPSLFI